MALETIIGNKTNFILVPERGSDYPSNNFYRSLKTSPLFDRTANRWKEYETSTTFTLTDQLLDIVLQFKYNPKSAEAMLSRFDNRLDSLDFSNDLDLGLNLKSLGVEDSLMHAIAKSFIDKSVAKDKYQNCKRRHYSIHDGSKNTWVRERGNGVTPVSTQLIAVLAESMIDKGKAFESFTRLKKTPFFDNSRNNWRFDEKQGDDFLEVSNQLVGVIIEAQFDVNYANSEYRQLKKRPFYDKNENKWSQWVKIDDRNYSEDPLFDKYSFTQLLGVWCMQLFEDQGFNVQTSQIPAKRMF